MLSEYSFESGGERNKKHSFSVLGDYMVLEGEMPGDNGETHRLDEKAEIFVAKKASLQAASLYARAGKRVCVLNFTNAFYPGSGVKAGMNAQEEGLCRCSTLYPCISDEKIYERYHREVMIDNNNIKKISELTSDWWGEQVDE